MHSAPDSNWKLCTKCRKFKRKTEFRKNKHFRDGLQIYCRPCINADKNEKRYPSDYPGRSNKFILP